MLRVFSLVAKYSEIDGRKYYEIDWPAFTALLAVRHPEMSALPAWEVFEHLRETCAFRSLPPAELMLLKHDEPDEEEDADGGP